MENAKTTKKNSPDISKDMKTNERAATPTTALRKAWSWKAQRVLMFKGWFKPCQNPGATLSMKIAVASGTMLKARGRNFPRAAKEAATASVSRTDATGSANFSIVALVIVVFVIGKSRIFLV